MKISGLVMLAANAANATGGFKEWEVQNAYFAEEEIILPDSKTRSNKQWHECGDAPVKPVNGEGVMCTGNICYGVCPLGSRSSGRWAIKCKADNTWSHSKFSPCITCPDMSEELQEAGLRGVQSQSIVNKWNRPVTELFCGDSTNWLGIKNEWYKRGGDHKSVICKCKKGQNGNPAWKKSCNWTYQNEPWSLSDVDTVQCKPEGFQPPVDYEISRYDLRLKDLTVYPNYEVSVDLKLDQNQHQRYSNIFGFHEARQPLYDGTYWTPGARIPAVFLLPGKNKLHVCSDIGTNANTCWNSPTDYQVGEWFNLKIKQQYQDSGYVYQIFINGELQFKLVNNNPKTFVNVQARMGHAYEPEGYGTGYYITRGRWRNLKFKSFE